MRRAPRPEDRRGLTAAEARRMAAVRAKTDLKLLTLDFETSKKVVVDSEETTMDFAEIIRERPAQT